LEYVNREDADERKAMIEMAEMALGSSDPNVKDHFLTKWLASVKPIKDEKK
jgi:hypothetical protein